MNKIIVIIPSYNRFKFLMNAINSIKNQTYKLSNIDILVINDASTEKEYYEYNWKSNNIDIINLEINSKIIFGYGCAGYVRNIGLKSIKFENYKYISFCDDDDIWLPNKLELQINEMEKSKCKMSCSEGLYGNGEFNMNLKVYLKYNSEYYYNYILNKYKQSSEYMNYNIFPYIWDYNFIKIHNCIICSSVIVTSDVIKNVGFMKEIKRGEDYDYWLRILKEYTSCVYVNEPCVYYDSNHGYGIN